VFPGSSGSPVFLVDRGGTFRDRRSGGVTVGGRFLCLGVLAAVHVQQVEGDVRDLPTRLAVTFNQPLGLGIVFKASTFDVCVDPLLVRAGLTRRPDTGPPEPGEPEAITDADRTLEEGAKRE
jgi:hypothetical protein